MNQTPPEDRFVTPSTVECQSADANRCSPIPGQTGFSRVPGLPDNIFSHDGLVTKRIIRAGAMAYLRPAVGQMLWDLGTGAGSIMVEWLLSCPETTAVGVEVKPERLARTRLNLEKFGLTSRARVELGDVLEKVADFPDPDAIFIGGGLSSGLLSECVSRLSAGGRLVAHSVTLEADLLLNQAQVKYGGELTRISVESVDKIGRFRSWKPARPVTQWGYLADD